VKKHLTSAKYKPDFQKNKKLLFFYIEEKKIVLSKKTSNF